MRRFIVVGSAIVLTVSPVVGAKATTDTEQLGIAGSVVWTQVSGPSSNPCGGGATSPRVAVDPGNANLRYVSYQVGDGGAEIVATSDDAGQTWVRHPVAGVSPCVGAPAPGFLVDGYVAAGPNGVVASTESFVSSSILAAGNAAAHDVLSMSFDRGATFDTPVNLEPAQQDQRGPVLVDTQQPSHVFVEVEHVLRAGAQYLEGTPAEVVVLRSTDGGRSFGSPVTLPPGVNLGALSIGLVKTESKLFAIYATVVPSVGGPDVVDGYLPMVLHASVSDDDGLTFGPATTIGTYPFPLGAPLNPRATSVPVGSGIPSASASSDGQVAVAWPDAPSGDIKLATTDANAQGWTVQSIASGTQPIEAEVASLGHGQNAVFFYSETTATTNTAVVKAALALSAPSGWSVTDISNAFDLASVTDGSTDVSSAGPMQGITAVPGGVDVTAALAGSMTGAGDIQAFNTDIRLTCRC